MWHSVNHGRKQNHLSINDAQNMCVFPLLRGKWKHDKSDLKTNQKSISNWKQRDQERERGEMLCYPSILSPTIWHQTTMKADLHIYNYCTIYYTHFYSIDACFCVRSLSLEKFRSQSRGASIWGTNGDCKMSLRLRMGVSSRVVWGSRSSSLRPLIGHCRISLEAMSSALFPRLGNPVVSRVEVSGGGAISVSMVNVTVLVIVLGL